MPLSLMCIQQCPLLDVQVYGRYLIFVLLNIYLPCLTNGMCIICFDILGCESLLS